MRYYQAGDTLIIRGTFRACSTGAEESIRDLTTLMLTSPRASNPYRPEWEIEKTASRHGLNPLTARGLITAGCTSPLCIFKYNQITLFMVRGCQLMYQDLQRADDRLIHDPHLSIICCVSGILVDHMLQEILSVIHEAIIRRYRDAGYQGNTTSGGIMIASECCDKGVEVNLLSVIQDTIHHAISLVLGPEFSKAEGKGGNEPLFYIHTTIGGDRWIRWKKGGCPYYPCHFKGQRCDLCYCPLYPCEDGQLGEWATGSRSGGKVWSCVPCTLNHQPAVVKHLHRNPEASVTELKALLKTISSQSQGMPGFQCQ